MYCSHRMVLCHFSYTTYLQHHLLCPQNNDNRHWGNDVRASSACNTHPSIRTNVNECWRADKGFSWLFCCERVWFYSIRVFHSKSCVRSKWLLPNCFTCAYKCLKAGFISVCCTRTLYSMQFLCVTMLISEFKAF